MNKKLLKILLILTVVVCLPFTMGAQASGAESVYVGGFATGVEIKMKGAYVIGLSDVVTETGVYSPAKQAGIVCGDRIMRINATEINCAFDITKALKDYTDGAVVAEIIRGDAKLLKDVTPKKDISGRFKLGLFVRDAIEGIGTLSFITENGEFMALGHPVCDDDGRICEITGGNVYDCSIYDVVKGERGKAGELKGIIISDKPFGQVTANYAQGIKGVISKDFDVTKLSKVEVGDGRPGKAEMMTCIDGVKSESFSISIVKAEFGDKKDKNYVIKVTDKRLIEYAGGIVQGMSGSPIVQDGKFVGCVTHVMLSDSTRGYGISAKNMLDALGGE